jgi:hypothetical protein
MVDLDEYDPPDRPDFRRVGKGIPYVVGLSGKRERYSRSSNGGKILDDESNLTDWKLRTVVAGAAQRPELMAKASVLDVDVNKKDLRDIAELCLVAGKGERRAVIGTAVHAMFDHIDRNDGWVPPPNFQALCTAYEEMKQGWGFEVQGIELHCINHQRRLAGTLDRRFRTTKTLVTPDGTIIPIGSILVVDHKTGKELEYAAGSYATQLAAYVDSDQYDVTTDETTPFDPPNYPDWALIVHADSAGTRVDVYWVDVNAGRLGLDLAGQVKGWRRRSDLLTMARTEPASSPAVAPVVAPAGPEHQDRAEYLRGRVRAVLAHSELAAKAMARAWPAGVPGLKQTGHTAEQLEMIQTAVEAVETNQGVPWFPAFKPDVDASINRHPSSGFPKSTDRAAQLVRGWLGQADLSTDQVADAIVALLPFGSLPEGEWSTTDIDTMLIGSIRALGLVGLDEMNQLDEAGWKQVHSLGFAVAAGQAALMFDEAGNPIVRVLSQGN